MLLGKCFSNGYVIFLKKGCLQHIIWSILSFNFIRSADRIKIESALDTNSAITKNKTDKTTIIKITYERFFLQKQNNTTPTTTIKATTPAIMADSNTVFSLLVSESLVSRSWKLDRKTLYGYKMKRICGVGVGQRHAHTAKKAYFRLSETHSVFFFFNKLFILLSILSIVTRNISEVFNPN